MAHVVLPVPGEIAKRTPVIFMYNRNIIHTMKAKGGNFCTVLFIFSFRFLERITEEIFPNSLLTNIPIKSIM